MNKIILSVISVLLLFSHAYSKDVHLIAPNHYEKKKSDSLLVKYKNQPDSNQLLNRLNIKRIALKNKITLQAQSKALKNDPAVQWVEANEWRYALTEKVEPNDIYYLPQRNDRQYQQWYLFIINANYAWSLAKGQDDFIVAVIDSGVDLNHPDLKERLISGRTIVNQEDYTPPANGMDDNGHGTHVAGLIAAMSNNETGISGCSWQGKILPVKVLNDQGEGVDADIAEGIIWATDQGARIINLSLGGESDSGELPQTLQDAVTYAHNHDVLIIAASGNSGGDEIYYPASLDHVVSVAATNPWDERAAYSTWNAYVDLAAPGGAGGEKFDRSTGMISTYWTSNSVYLDNMTGTEAGEYAVTAGTSMAAAIVSGAALVIWSQDPTLTAGDIENRLKVSATDILPSGSDQQTGSGRINLLEALGSPVPSLPSMTVYNYPNPFNPDKDKQTSIVFILDEQTGCEISLYDVGRDLVWQQKISKEQTLIGKNYLGWDGRNSRGNLVSNGTYLLHIKADNNKQSKIKFIAVIR